MPIGPSRPLNLAKPESIDIRQAARYFGARGEADSATLTLLEKCAAPLLAAATPRAVWLEADVDSLLEAGILQGWDVMKHLEISNYSRDVNTKYIVEWVQLQLWKMVAKTDTSRQMRRSLYRKA